MYVCMYVCRFTSFITTIIWWKPITITKVIRYPVLVWRKWILLYLYLSERLTNQCSKSLLIGVGRGALVDWFYKWTKLILQSRCPSWQQTTRGNQLYSYSHPSAQTLGLSNDIEVVAENIFRLFAFPLANHVLVHIQ